MLKKDISKRLNEIIINKNITRSKVSKLSKISLSKINKFIDNDGDLKLRDLCIVFNALKIEMDYNAIMDSINEYYKYDLSNKEVYISHIDKLANVLNINAYKIYDFKELKSSVLKLEDIEVKYNMPVFNQKYLNKDFSLDKNLLNASCREVEKPYVIDGDTLNVYYDKLSIRVRLLVIDTPETVKTSDLWGMQASEFTKYLIKKSTNIYIQLDNKVEKFDKYKRLLAWVWIKIDNKMKLLNSMLVQSGLAEVRYVDNEDSLYVKVLREQEREAKNRKRIMWGYEQKDPYWDYQDNELNEPCYIIEVKNQYIKVLDYDMKEWVISNTATKFRSIEDCKKLVRVLKIKYNIKEINLKN